jgi:hypothetical protein
MVRQIEEEDANAERNERVNVRLIIEILGLRVWELLMLSKLNGGIWHFNPRGNGIAKKIEWRRKVCKNGNIKCNCGRWSDK